MKIFLSHQSRDKPLVNDFKEHLPSFLSSWLDEESLTWGGGLATQLQNTIQTAVDFLVVFLDKDSLGSEWVRQEINWAIEREFQLKRTFILPVLLPGTTTAQLPSSLGQRLHLRLGDYSRSSIEALANKATEQLFKLVLESYACVQLELPDKRSLEDVQGGLSAGQARLLGCVVKLSGENLEAPQRQIEAEMDQSHANAELFYRLESLIAQGFLTKRRLPQDGSFAYRVTDEFRALRQRH